MNREALVSTAIGSYFSFAVGLGWYFTASGQPLSYSLWMAIYWGYLASCLVFLLISLYKRFAMFPKLTTYFQIWGTLGTFVGLIQMCSTIDKVVGVGDMEAIKGVLGGFSTALVTSLIGMVLALVNDMLPEEEADESADATPVPEPVPDVQASTAETQIPIPPVAQTNGNGVQNTVPQTVVYQAVMPPINVMSPVQSKAQAKGGYSKSASNKGGGNHETA